MSHDNSHRSISDDASNLAKAAAAVKGIDDVQKGLQAFEKACDQKPHMREYSDLGQAGFKLGCGIVQIGAAISLISPPIGIATMAVGGGLAAGGKLTEACGWLEKKIGW
ncbi:MAG: hypothetical protein EAY65_03665 [Alphaproteobacteria bacterium]|nr:MAG: hypothetical protein EAY65_03665 [Alphaproteobacteria bacterium]